MLRILFLILILQSYSCRILSGKIDPRQLELIDIDYHCGLHNDYHFDDETLEETYPDLGLVIAHADKLKLTRQQIQKILKLADTCYKLCTIDKEKIQLKQQVNKAMIKNKPGMKKALIAIKEVELLKTKWLTDHSKRYKQGLRILSKDQLNAWLLIASNYRVLPR